MKWKSESSTPVIRFNAFSTKAMKIDTYGRSSDSFRLSTAFPVYYNQWLF